MIGGRATDVATRHPASFRDPTGHVYVSGDRVFRTVTEAGRQEYEFVRASGLHDLLIGNGQLIAAKEVGTEVLAQADEQVPYVLEHPRLPFISYPYEWPFPALKEAALLTLRIHVAALERDVTLSDASAYNIQFRGAEPVFIDYLSFRRYRDGEFWYGHRQFCQQLLNPLLLTAFTGVPFNAFYRGSLDGIPASQLRQVLPWRRLFNWQVFTNVVLQAKLESGSLVDRESHRAVAARKLPKIALSRMLRSLEAWIGKLEPLRQSVSRWGNYADDNSYAQAEREAKRRFVAVFAAKTRPSMLWDLGCNTGEYAEVALNEGASFAVGFDVDHGALNAAFARARAKHLPLLILYSDAANPSPDQGWAQRERAGIAQRGPADAALALALIHHLAIGNNVPLGEVIRWVVQMAPTGVIEFVPKSDPMVQTMLAGRTDIFEDYSEESFFHHLDRCASVVQTEQITEAGRKLVWYSR